MLGRALFAVICLVVASGLALPLFPPRVQIPGLTITDTAATASAVTTSCAGQPFEHPPAEVACPSACPCGHALLAAYPVPEASFVVLVQLVIRPLPAGLPVRPEPLPPKLPRI